MVTAIGIDPGTKSMDVFGFDDKTDEVVMDLAIPRVEVTKNPEIVLDAIREIDREIDVIVGPSGYGLPMVKASEAADAEINAATFITKADVARRLNIVGLRELMFHMKKSNLNIWFPPGVIHLPTVPEYRKINRIDMGTADKVFTAVSGIKDQAEKYSIAYAGTSFIALEIGFGYTAALGIENGKIVDGVGGTIGGVGYMGMGAMDGELAYALANTIADFSKMMLFNGGAASISQIDPQKVSIEEFISLARNSEPQVKLAYSAMLESIIKDTYLMLSSVRKPKEILLSGRFTRIKPFVQDVTAMLQGHLSEFGIEAEIRTLTRTGGEVKEAAEGAAVIANGIAGGKYERLIETMELRKSTGGVFSHIYLDKETRERIEETFKQ
ncbi:MAG TPA: DUF1464 family protein [Candidatus Bathyarchaeia archaeon]|nr:DUF1464 family protein [Candidatus Bathyarchaeia archaeon]